MMVIGQNVDLSAPNIGAQHSTPQSLQNSTMLCRLKSSQCKENRSAATATGSVVYILQVCLHTHNGLAPESVQYISRACQGCDTTFPGVIRSSRQQRACRVGSGYDDFDFSDHGDDQLISTDAAGHNKNKCKPSVFTHLILSRRISAYTAPKKRSRAKSPVNTILQTS